MSRRYAEIINMTNFFNRELMMYSLGDIKLKKPIALKKVAYVTGFFIIWSLPLILIFGLVLNVYFAILVLAPPLVIGHYASKPVWGGKGLIDFTKTLITYLGEPKSWTDLKANKSFNKDKYFIESEIWISRRRELQLLADLKEKQRTNTTQQQG